MHRSTDFEAGLARRFQPAAAVDADLALCLAVGGAGGERLATFAVRNGELRFDPTLCADATFFFDSADTALAILDGSEDPMAAFMAGRFRSDGHLPLAFALLALFQPGRNGRAPP